MLYSQLCDAPQLRLRLGLPANDNVPSVAQHERRAQRYLRLVRLLEERLDRGHIAPVERQRLQRFRKLHRWHSLWVIVWRRCGGTCERNCVRPMQELHHLRYPSTPDTEQAEDMQGLCSHHHWIQHHAA